MGDANSPAGRIKATGCLVELQTDAGLTGIGISTGRARAEINNIVKNVLLNEDPCAVISLWQKMLDFNFVDDQRGLINEAISVLDMSLWDLNAKANDEPLWKTLGSGQPRANVYASDVGLALTDEQIIEWYTMMMRDYGVRGGKLKVGLDQEADIR